jgi:hypothetical protein
LTRRAKSGPLCKFIAHNLCVLVQEEQELGIAAEFRPQPPTETRVLPV